MRIEGAFEGEITLRGLLVVGETGRVTCQNLRANAVIVAGAVRGDITAEKVEIRSTGRVWGDVVTAAFATEEGAFLRGQIRMEDEVDIETGLPPENKPTPDEVEKAKLEPQEEEDVEEEESAEEEQPLAEEIEDEENDQEGEDAPVDEE